jgi:hypothetical protein
MREAILSKQCDGWDMIRTSEKEICYGEIIPEWADEAAAPQVRPRALTHANHWILSLK